MIIRRYHSLLTDIKPSPLRLAAIRRGVVVLVCVLGLMAAPVSGYAAKGEGKDKKEKQQKTKRAANASKPSDQNSRIGKSDDGRLDIKPMARITFEPLNESSGLARSVRFPGIYWTHNDSGDRARIFAIHADGSVIHPASVDLKTYAGIEIAGARNVDWEDITSDGQGRLIIADCGNNNNDRQDLTLYVIQEPDPERDLKAAVLKTLPVNFPEQRFTPDEPMNFDCEAIFMAGGRIHLLTKHRADTRTCLYRLENEVPGRPNPLKLIGETEVGDMVTSADLSPDGHRLAVLTYSAAWLFEGARSDGNFLRAPARCLPIKAGQCESICFEGERLLIGNEKGNLFRVPLGWLKPYQGEKLEASKKSKD